jgi:hypothetical protein
MAERLKQFAKTLDLLFIPTSYLRNIRKLPKNIELDEDLKEFRRDVYKETLLGEAVRVAAYAAVAACSYYMLKG